MFEGKCSAALKILSGECSNLVPDGEDVILSGGEEVKVRDVQHIKHPPGQPANGRALFSWEEPPPTAHHVVFDCIDADLIRTASKETGGAAGSSGFDAHSWKRLCSTFQ